MWVYGKAGSVSAKVTVSCDVPSPRAKKNYSSKGRPNSPRVRVVDESKEIALTETRLTRPAYSLREKPSSDG